MAWQLSKAVIDHGPVIRRTGVSHRAYIALQVIAEGCHDSTHTGRVARSRIAGALGVSERSTTDPIKELTDAGLVIVEQVGHAVSTYDGARRTGVLRRATLYRLTPLAVGELAPQEPSEGSHGGPEAPQEPRGSHGEGAPQEPRGSHGGGAPQEVSGAPQEVSGGTMGTPGFPLTSSCPSRSPRVARVREAPSPLSFPCRECSAPAGRQCREDGRKVSAHDARRTDACQVAS